MSGNRGVPEICDFFRKLFRKAISQNERMERVFEVNI